MSASNRKIHRLPDRVFEDLITRPTKAVIMIGDEEEKTKENSNNNNGDTSGLNHDGVENVTAGACANTGENVTTNDNNNNNDDDNNDNIHNNPSLLRQQICHRLQRVPVRYVTGGRFFSRRVRVDRRSHRSPDHQRRDQQHNNNSTTTTTTTLKIETVGELLMLSKYTLLLVLDPILTYEEIEIMLARISFHCAPRPVNVLKMKQQQSSNRNSNDITLPAGVSAGSASTTNVQNIRDVSRSTKKRFQHRQIHPSFVIPTGLENLDRLLRGGIRVGTVTELVGRSGVGKTQIAFQLAIMAAKANYSTIYIDTEKKISIHRLKEMAAYRYNNALSSLAASQGGQVPFSYGGHSLTTSLTANSQQYSSHPASSSQDAGTNNNSNINFKHAEDVVKNMTFRQPNNTEELLQTLKSLEAEIVHWNDDNTGVHRQDQHRTSEGTIDKDQNNHHLDHHYHHHQQHPSASISNLSTSRKHFPVRLIVVDSIAATMRRDFGTDALPQRASAIFQCAQILKRLADHLSIAIFVINQVGGADNSNNDISGSDATGVITDPTAVKAALGTSWHHCVSTRLFMEKAMTIPQQHHEHQQADEYEGEHWQQQQRRSKVAVVKSNLVPLAETSYEISTAGIV